MPLIDPDKQIQRPSPSIRQGANQLIIQLNSAVNQTEQALLQVRRVVETHTRAALSAELTAMGESPAELLSVYNAAKTFIETADIDRIQDPLPS